MSVPQLNFGDSSYGLVSQLAAQNLAARNQRMAQSANPFDNIGQQVGSAMYGMSAMQDAKSQQAYRQAQMDKLLRERALQDAIMSGPDAQAAAIARYTAAGIDAGNTGKQVDREYQQGLNSAALTGLQTNAGSTSLPTLASGLTPQEVAAYGNDPMAALQAKQKYAASSQAQQFAAPIQQALNAISASYNLPAMTAQNPNALYTLLSAKLLEQGHAPQEVQNMMGAVYSPLLGGGNPMSSMLGQSVSDSSPYTSQFLSTQVNPSLEAGKIQATNSGNQMDLVTALAKLQQDAQQFGVTSGQKQQSMTQTDTTNKLKMLQLMLGLMPETTNDGMTAKTKTKGSPGQQAEMLKLIQQMMGQ